MMCDAPKQKDITMPLTSEWKSATHYNEYPIPELNNNPLIAALPLITDNETEQSRRLIKKPAFSEDERNLPDSIRILLLNRLRFDFYLPSPQHVSIYKSIEGQIVSGYWTRNPATPEGQALVHGVTTIDAGGSPSVHRSISPGTLSILLGLSGLGKSALLDSIQRAMGPLLIIHSSFHNHDLAIEAQIVSLRRNMTDQPNSMIKGISKVLADRADQVLGKQEYGSIFMDKSMTRTHYSSSLGRILATHWVGLVVIDVFEHVSLAGTKGKRELLNLLDNMRDELGVPILLSSTYECSDLLDVDSFRTARRFVDGGVYDLTRPGSSEDEDFKEFCDVCWQYQWVRKPIALSILIRECLYDFSQGITAILLLLFRLAQEYAIRQGTECVDEKTLRIVYSTYLSPLQGILSALRKGDLRLYEHLYLKAMRKVDSGNPVNRLNEMREASGVSPLAPSDEQPQINRDPAPQDSNDEIMRSAMGLVRKRGPMAQE